MQIKSDQDEEKVRNDLSNNRQNIRSQFNLAANELEDYGKEFIKDNVVSILNNSIHEIDKNIDEIRATRNNRNKSCKEMEKLKNECQGLIQDIHNM